MNERAYEVNYQASQSDSWQSIEVRGSQAADQAAQQIASWGAYNVNWRAVRVSGNDVQTAWIVRNGRRSGRA